MYNVKLLNKIAKIGTDRFGSNYVCAEEIENPVAIMVRSASMHETTLDDSTLCVARAGAGVNNIPLDKFAEQGVVVFNTPGANANAVKELVVAGLLLASRNIAPAMDWAKTLKGSGDETLKLVEKGKSQFTGPEIMGKTLGVVGLGAIGILVAQAAVALGMKVVGYDPFLSVSAAIRLPKEVKYVAELDDVYAESDYITLHLPLNAETKGMINKDAIAKMRDNVRILNFARDALVCDPCMLEALKSGKVARYVTDFPTDAVIGEENVVALPHLGASTPESEDNCAVMAADEIKNYLENGNIVNSVNMPRAEFGAVSAGVCRLCVICKNAEQTVSAVSSAIAGAERSATFTRGDYAYIMADFAGDAQSALEKTKAVDEVVRARVICG
ncbi:MAG: 3-phosphoglycerate dehydrogenase [Ruminococcaceae bacterium]|nr:3-phosphoglycerate dehydrogenase [Oscillospiraceae bacterium]